MSTIVFGSGFREGREHKPDKPGAVFMLIGGARDNDPDNDDTRGWHSADRASLLAFAEARGFSWYYVRDVSAPLPALHGDARDRSIAHLLGLSVKVGPPKKAGQARTWVGGAEYIRRLMRRGVTTLGELLALEPRELRALLGLGNDWEEFRRADGPQIIEDIGDAVLEELEGWGNDPGLRARAEEMFGLARKAPREKFDHRTMWDGEAA